jgi:hypothetical protein
MPWPLFYRLRKAAARLKRDPSPLVRANALHVEFDARTVREREATIESLQEREARRRIAAGHKEAATRRPGRRQ